MANEPWNVYILFNALKLHFTNSSYDAEKYNYKTQASKRSFLGRNDKYFFAKIERKYPKVDDQKDFFIANLVYTKGKCWIGDCLTNEGEARYLKWKKIQESLSETIRSDVKTILRASEAVWPTKDDVPPTNNQLFDCSLISKNNDHPIVVQEYLAETVQLETLVILNSILKFADHANKKIDETIVWPELYMLIKKYQDLYKFNINKIVNVILNTVKNYY